MLAAVFNPLDATMWVQHATLDLAKGRMRQKCKQKETFQWETRKRCPTHFVVTGSRSSTLVNPLASLVLCLPCHYTPYKQETKSKSVYDHLAKPSVKNAVLGHNFIHQSTVPSETRACPCVCMVWSWPWAKPYTGNFTRTIIQKGQTRFRFETKAKTGHLEAVRKLFQILNRAGGLCISP